MRAITAVMTTLIILVASIVLGTGVVLYGASLGSSSSSNTTLTSNLPPTPTPKLTQQTYLSPFEADEMETYMNTEKYLNDKGIQLWVSGEYTVCPASENKTCQQWYNKNKIITPNPAHIIYMDKNSPIAQPYDSNQQIINKLNTLIDLQNKTNYLVAESYCRTQNPIYLTDCITELMK